MRIAITGANGQVGQALQSVLYAHHDIVPLGHADIELDQPDTVAQIVSTRAQLVIHSAAYTNTDGAARDPQMAYRINGLGTKYVALGCQRLNAPMVYISSNEVFGGDGDRPYMEYDQPNPINAYGRSKLVGEQVVRDLLTQFYIVRLAWVFGGERNFVRTIIKLASEQPGLRMVTDEISSPTYAADAAEAIGRLIFVGSYGTYHLVNEGSTSRYDFARAILHRMKRDGYPVAPITLAEYPRASTPPRFSPLANIAGSSLGITLRPWQDALDNYLNRLREANQL